MMSFSAILSRSGAISVSPMFAAWSQKHLRVIHTFSEFSTATPVELQS